MRHTLRAVTVIVAAMLVAPALGDEAPARAEVAAGAWIGWGPSDRWRAAAPPYGYSGCVPPWCLGADPYLVWRMLERQRRFDELRRGPTAPATGAPFRPAATSPPQPTPDSQIQPAYRNSSVVRPEFAESGRPRP